MGGKEGEREREEFFALSTAKTTSKIAFLQTPAEAVEFWTEWPPFFGAEKGEAGSKSGYPQVYRMGIGEAKMGQCRTFRQPKICTTKYTSTVEISLSFSDIFPPPHALTLLSPMSLTTHCRWVVCPANEVTLRPRQNPLRPPSTTDVEADADFDDIIGMSK